MNTCRIIRLVENVGIEPLFLFPKQECYHHASFSIWWLDYLSSHQPFESCRGAADSLPCATIRQVLPPDIMYYTIALTTMSIPFSKFSEIFFTHNLSENASRFDKQILPIKLHQIQLIVANCNQNPDKLSGFSCLFHAFGKFCSLFGGQVALDRRLRRLEP